MKKLIAGTVLLGAVAAFGASVSDYVQNGLIAEWDAIDNVGTGAHDASAKVWKDLKGSGGDMPILANEVWKDGRCLHFNGSVNAEKYNGNCTNLLASKTFSLQSVTIEAVVKPVVQQYGNRWFDAYPHQATFETYGGANQWDSFYVQIGSTRMTLSCQYGTDTRYTFQATYDAATKGLTASEWRGTCRTGWWSGTATEAVTIPSRLQFANTATSGYEVYAIRVYDRALTTAERQANALVDAERFPEYTAWGLSDAVMCAAGDLTAGYPFRSDANLVNPGVRGVKSANAIVKTAADWAPDAVYQAERYYAVLTNTISGLVPYRMYRVDYLGAETYYSEAKRRVFDVNLHGTTVLKNLDLFTAGGGANHAVTRSFYTPANGWGQIQTILTRSADNAKYGGLAVFAGVKPSDASLKVEQIVGTTNVKLTYAATDALTYCVQRAASPDGPWTDLATTLNDRKSLTDTLASTATAYYRVVCSNGLGIATSPVKSLAIANSVYALNLGPRGNATDRFGSFQYLTSSAAYVIGGYTTGTTQPTADLAHPIPAEMGRDFLYANNMTFTLPNLRAGNTYQLRLYAVDNYYEAANQRVFNVAVNGTTVETGVDIFARTKLKDKVLELDYSGLAPNADGAIVVTLTGTTDSPQLCALELVEETVDQVPLVPTLTVAARKEGNAVAIGMQCAATRYDIQRQDGGAWTTIATNAPNAFLDVGAAATATYRARAINPVSAATSDWSASASVGPSPKAFLGVCHPSLAGTYDGRTYEAFTTYGPDYQLNWDLSLTFDRSAIFEPLPAKLYTKAFARGPLIQNFKGLYPYARYRVRLHGFCPADDVRFTPHVNYDAPFGMIAGSLAYGKNQPYVFETEAVANAQGNLYVRIDADTNGRQRVFAEELILDESGDAAGAATQAKEGEATLNARLTIPETGVYTFTKAEGAAGRLFIDEDEIAPLAATGAVTLEQGVHAIRYRAAGAAATLAESVTWSGLNVPAQSLAGKYVTHDAALGAGAGDLATLTLAQDGSVKSGDIRPVAVAESGDVTWSLQGSGHDFSETHDTAFGAYRAVRGAFEAKARVRDMRLTSRYPKVGIMVRTALEPLKGDYAWFSAIENRQNNYTNNWMWCCDGDDYRDGAYITQKHKVENVGLYTWVRVRRTRVDGVYKLYAGYSKDGSTWIDQEVPCSQRGKVYAGLFVCSTQGGEWDKEFWTTSLVDHLTIDDQPPGFFIMMR